VFDEEPDTLRMVYENIPTSASISVTELAVASSLQPEEVPPAVDVLRAKGAWVAGDAADGYRRQLPPPLDPGAISALVKGRVGAALFLHDAVASTMVKARELAAEDGCHGAAVLAEEQVAGRGRYGRGWSSPRRLGLYISVVLEKRYLSPRLSLLPLMAGVAVTDAIAAVAGVAAEMKWPNDLLWKGAKLGGILGEAYGEPAAVVLGFGVNVFQCVYDFPRRVIYPATSLAQAGAGRVDRNALAAEMLNSLDRWLERWLKDGPEPVMAAWRERNVTLGRRIRIAGTGVAGVAVDLTEDGALVVEDHTGRRRVFYSADA
jgi:BirA family biotin operon repressor/biotin-[acetyl-CoA-carboxylase] ligase